MDDSLLEKAIKEGVKLGEKINKLEDFIKSDKFSKLDITNQILLRRQLRYMQQYFNVLYFRVSFNKYIEKKKESE